MAGFLEPIRLKDLGRKYRIDGLVFRTNLHDPISFASDLVDRKMEITFDVRSKRGLLGNLESPGANQTHFQIKCFLAKDQATFFRTLSEGDSVTLTGTVTEFGRFGMEISEARRAD